MSAGGREGGRVYGCFLFWWEITNHNVHTTGLEEVGEGGEEGEEGEVVPA